MIDIRCIPPDEGEDKFTFYPLSENGRKWFEYMIDAIPDEDSPYMADASLSRSITKKMLLEGLQINSAAETERFKQNFRIKDSEIKPSEPPIRINEVVVDPVPVPDKLDFWDTRRLAALKVVWDRPDWFPEHWAEGRNRNKDDRG